MSLRCDLIFRDATIFDGTGKARYQGDVGVTGDQIAALGDLGGISADREIIASGKALAPGFIDAHTHDDRAVLCGPACMMCKMSQGITTVVVGNCGISLSPVPMSERPIPPLDLLGDHEWWRFDSFSAYAREVERRQTPVNVLALIGHMSLRFEAMGGDMRRPASDREAARMQTRLQEALQEGAAGLSTGLFYPPSGQATTDEVIAVAQALRAAGGVYVTHMRDESNGVVESIQETLKIGRDAGVPVIISHHKCTLPENFGRSRETLALIRDAAARQKVAFDVYPYSASSTVLLPERVREDVPIRISWSIPHPEMTGRYLAEIAAEWRLGLRAAAEKLLPAGAILFQMDEADVQQILADPDSMVGSDGLPHDEFPHPRLWGSFPRVLGHYARDLKLFSMEQAIHKMTGRTAAVFGIADRGIIQVGAFADLVLFDPETVIDSANFDAPKTRAAGIEASWVNGQLTYQAGMADDASGDYAGRVLRRSTI